MPETYLKWKGCITLSLETRLLFSAFLLPTVFEKQVVCTSNRNAILRGQKDALIFIWSCNTAKMIWAVILLYCQRTVLIFEGLKCYRVTLMSPFSNHWPITYQQSMLQRVVHDTQFLETSGWYILTRRKNSLGNSCKS